MKHFKYLMVMLILALVAVMPFVGVSAQEESPPYPADTITVTGFGSAPGTPDIANMVIGVSTIDPNVATAFTDNNAKVQAIVDAMIEIGVAREDIRTLNVNIGQDFSGPMGPASSGMAQEEPQQPNYRVGNDIRVTIRDIDSVADVITAAVNAGANNIYGLEFGIDDRSALQSEARQAAMDDAQARAEELAGLIGAELGEAIIVNEGFSGFPMPFETMNMSVGMGGGGVPIEPGQLSVTMQIQVTYRINR